MATPRLMLLVDSLKAGGTERQVLLLADGLSRRGWEAKVVVLGGEVPPAVDPASRPFGVLRLAGPGLLWSLRREVAASAPDLLISFSARPHAYCLGLKALGRAPRWVVGVRDSNPLYSIRRPAALLSDALAFGARLGVTAFVSNSAAALRAKALAGAPDALVLPNILDVRFKPRDRREARRRIGLPPDSFVLGAVCNTTPYKGLEALFEACAGARAAHLVLVGERRGRYGERLLEGARARLGGRFTYLGPRDDVHEVMPAFDLYCSSSLSEGASNSIGEAMACGLPCVVTDAGDSADLVAETGWVVPKGDAAALARAIDEAHALGGEALAARGMRGRERIARLWEPGRALAAHDAALRDLAVVRPRPAAARSVGARRFAALACALTVLMALSTWRGTWVGDFWEHAGTVRELRQNPFAPTHPQVVSEAPSPYFSPYFITLGLASRLTGLSVIDTLALAGMANLLLLLWGVWTFARRADDDGAPPLTPSYFLAFLLVLWGAQPWNWSSVFHLNSLGKILPYPSTFAAAMTLLISAGTRPALVSGSLAPTAWAAAGMALVCLVHPSTAIPLYALTCSEALAAGRLPKYVAAAVVSVALALAWPFYPFAALLVGDSNLGIHAANAGLYAGVVGRTWPALLVGLPLTVSRLKVRLTDPLAVSALFLGTVYLAGGVTGRFAFGRSLPYLVLTLQLMAAAWAARLEIAARAGDRAARLMILGLLGLAAASAIGFLPAVHAPLFGGRESYRDSEFLRRFPSVVGDRDVVLANLDLSTMLPGFSGRVVTRRWPLIWVRDDGRRKADIAAFFAPGSGCAARALTAQRYGARFVALKLRGESADAAADEIARLPWLAAVLEDDGYRLLAVRPSPRCPEASSGATLRRTSSPGL